MQPVHQATREIHDPWLANVFAHLFLPDVPVVFIMMLLGGLTDRNIAIRKDGSGGFVRALENVILI